jgi:hypothetical protein
MEIFRVCELKLVFADKRRATKALYGTFVFSLEISNKLTNRIFLHPQIFHDDKNFILNSELGNKKSYFLK